MSDPYPMVLLHGALGNQAQFDILIPYLKHKFEIVTFNFTGHGGRLIPDQLTMDVLVAELKAFLENSFGHPVFVFGYSMGGYVALKLAATEHGMISKLMTLGTKMNWNPETAVRQVKMLDPDVIEIKVPKFAEDLQKRHQPQDWKLLMNRTAEMMAGLGNGMALADSDFGKIPIPVLISVGDADQMVSLEESAHVANLLPHGQFYCFENCKHPIEEINMPDLAKEILKYFGGENTDT